MWWRSILFMGGFFGFLVFLIPNIIWVVSWAVARIFGGKVAYTPFLIVAVALLLLVWIVLAYGYFFGRFRSEVNQVEYSSKDLPASFDGFRIVHISDLHVDSFDKHPEALRRILDKANQQHPDIILFTGDMTTAEFDDIRLHEQTLQSLQAPQGVVSVLGNHDFFIYCPEYTTDAQRCQAADRLTAYERDVLHWRVLRNESMTLRRGDDSIVIAGVDNINGNQGFSTIQQGDLRKALSGLDTGSRSPFTVLMTHDPSHWEAEVLPKSAVQVTLSGHTHAAQFRLFGWSPANLAFRECDGRYDHQGRMLYVSAGIGCTVPFRVGCPAEITVITLRSK